MERTDSTARLAMVPDPSEMSRTGSVLCILDISDGSDKGSQEQLSWSPLAPHRIRFATQNRPLKSAVCNSCQIRMSRFITTLPSRLLGPSLWGGRTG